MGANLFGLTADSRHDFHSSKKNKSTLQTGVGNVAGVIYDSAKKKLERYELAIVYQNEAALLDSKLRPTD